MKVRITPASARASLRVANFTVLFTILKSTAYTFFQTLQNCNSLCEDRHTQWQDESQKSGQKSTITESTLMFSVAQLPGTLKVHWKYSDFYRKYIETTLVASEAARTDYPPSSNPELRPHIPHVKYTPGGSPTSLKLIWWYRYYQIFFEIFKMVKH